MVIKVVIKKPIQNIVFKGHLVGALSFSKKFKKGLRKMRNSLQKRLSRKGWTGKQLSAFLKKHGIIRGWKTVLNDLGKGIRSFPVNRIGGCVVLSQGTAAKYIRFILENKKKNIKSTGIVDDIIKDLNGETKKRSNTKT